jgi:hypothetical protein
MREKLLGSWRLVAWDWDTVDGAVQSPLGEDPLGQITYDASGTVSAQLMRRDQLHFRDEDWRRATDEEKAAAWSGYFGYFGTFTVDEDAGVVVHHVEGGSFPNLVGTAQVRRCSFNGDQMSLAADTPWGQVRIVWEKMAPCRPSTGSG